MYTSLNEMAKIEKLPANVRVANMLSKESEFFGDMAMLEGNEVDGHTSEMRTGLPATTFRKYYGGVLPTKGSMATVFDGCMMAEQLAKVDCDLADRSNDLAEYRWRRDQAHIEGIKNDVLKQAWYGNSAAEPEKVLGFLTRFSDFDAPNGKNMIDAGGKGKNNTSIAIISHDDTTYHAITPQGSATGLQHTDLGRKLTKSPYDDGELEMYVSKYKWDIGWAMPDWRFHGAIRNIDVTQLKEDCGSGLNLVNALIRLQNRLYNLNRGKVVIYVNRTIKTFFELQLANKGNVWFTQVTIAERPQLFFRGVPIHLEDSLLDTEEAIPAAVERVEIQFKKA